MRRFRPSFWPSLAVALFVPLCWHLSNWQANKAEQKIAEQQRLVARAQQPPVPLPSTLGKIDDDTVYQQVVVRGHFVREGSFLWDNQIHQGRAGFYALSPFRTEDGRMVMVNRGWLPFSGDRTRPPMVSVPSGEVSIEGDLVRHPTQSIDPRYAPRWGDAVWAVVDLPLLMNNLGGFWIEGMVRQSAPSALVASAPNAIIDNPPLVRDWAPPNINVAQNISYAWQWKIIAALTLMAWLYFSMVKAPTPPTPNKGALAGDSVAHSSAPPARSSQPKTCWPLIAIAAVVFIPGLLAMGVFYGGYRPAPAPLAGQLLSPPPAINWPRLERVLPIGARPFNQDDWQKNWSIVYRAPNPCSTECIRALYTLRAVHLGQGEHSLRLQRIVLGNELALLRQWANNDPGLIVLHEPSAQSAALAPSTLSLQPDFWKRGDFWILDPQAHLVLAYPSTTELNRMKREIKPLIRD